MTSDVYEQLGVQLRLPKVWLDNRHTWVSMERILILGFSWNPAKQTTAVHYQRWLLSEQPLSELGLEPDLHWANLYGYSSGVGSYDVKSVDPLLVLESYMEQKGLYYCKPGDQKATAEAVQTQESAWRVIVGNK